MRVLWGLTGDSQDTNNAYAVFSLEPYPVGVHGDRCGKHFRSAVGVGVRNGSVSVRCTWRLGHRGRDHIRTVRRQSPSTSLDDRAGLERAGLSDSRGPFVACRAPKVANARRSCDCHMVHSLYRLSLPIFSRHGWTVTASTGMANESGSFGLSVR